MRTTKMKTTVYITVEGGIIQDITSPADITVIVRDYDTDGCTEEELQYALKDKQGDYYFESAW